MEYLRTNTLLLFVLLTPPLLALAGCSRESDLGLVPVEGTVTLDGIPVADATVYAVPDGIAGKTAYATTRHDGSFRLATRLASATDRDGIMPGNYKVTVVSSPSPAATSREGEMSPVQRAMMQKQSAQPDAVPRFYGEIATTPLRCVAPVQGRLTLELHRNVR